MAPAKRMRAMNSELMLCILRLFELKSQLEKLQVASKHVSEKSRIVLALGSIEQAFQALSDPAIPK